MKNCLPCAGRFFILFYALVCPVCMRVSKTKVSETLLLLEGGVPEGGGGRKNKY